MVMSHVALDLIPSDNGHWSVFAAGRDFCSTVVAEPGPATWLGVFHAWHRVQLGACRGSASHRSSMTLFGSADVESCASGRSPGTGRCSRVTVAETRGSSRRAKRNLSDHRGGRQPAPVHREEHGLLAKDHRAHAEWERGALTYVCPHCHCFRWELTCGVLLKWVLQQEEEETV